MEASKELVGELLINSDGVPVRKYDLEELVPEVQIYELSKHQERLHHVQVYSKVWVMDGIATLRGCSHLAYVQKNKFPGQGSDSDKVFVFKMSEVGPGSGVHLVKRM
jgi:hypothetical protein